MIGFIILLPFIDLSEDIATPMLIFYSIISWIIGLFSWGILELWFFPLLGHTAFLSSNNLNWINKEYQRLLNNGQIISKEEIEEKGFCKELSLYDYYKIYFFVTRKSLLGPIPALESFSAFFRNLVVILIIWIIPICLISSDCFTFHCGPYVMSTCTSSQPCTEYCFDTCFVIIMCCLSIFLCLGLRCMTEKKIYSNIIETYLLNTTSLKNCNYQKS